VCVSDFQHRSIGDGGAGNGGLRSTGGDAGHLIDFNGKRASGVSSVAPAAPPVSDKRGGCSKRPRRRVGHEDVCPVEVKREEAVDRVADGEESASVSSSGAEAGAGAGGGATVVKTEDMEVSCKVEESTEEA